MERGGEQCEGAGKVKRKMIGKVVVVAGRHRRLRGVLDLVLLVDLIDVVYEFLHVPRFTALNAFDAEDPVIWPLQIRRFSLRSGRCLELPNVGDGYRFHMNAVIKRDLWYNAFGNPNITFCVDDPDTIRQWMIVQSRLQLFVRECVSQSNEFPGIDPDCIHLKNIYRPTTLTNTQSHPASILQKLAATRPITLTFEWNDKVGCFRIDKEQIQEQIQARDLHLGSSVRVVFELADIWVRTTDDGIMANLHPKLVTISAFA